MKNQSLLVFTLAFFGALGVAHAGPVVTLNPSGPLTISNGGTATLGIVISGLPEPVAGWDVSVLFAPAAFSVNLPSAVAFGDPVNGDQLDFGFGVSTLAEILTTSNPAINALHLAEVSFAPDSALAAQLPTFTLATVTFSGVPGTQSTPGLQLNTLVGGTGNIISNNTVPEPATWLLGAAGLAAVAAFRHRRSQSAS